MLRRSFFFLILSLVALAVVLPAWAGGWAVITLDELPVGATAGEPLVIGFTVRQHGKTPMADLEPTIQAWNTSTGERFTIRAEPDGPTGHYTAALNLPSAGSWEWSIQAFTMDQQMPPLEVQAAGQREATSQTVLPPLPVWVGALSLASAAGAFAILIRRRVRWAFVVVLAGLLVSGLAFASVAAGQDSEPVSAADHDTRSTEGEELFIAKGCITCHAHAEIKRDRNTIYVDAGPDLSRFTADPEYLRRWLSDPASVKTETLMPNLGLDEAEIEVLVAFLNAE